jgi:hypothetical protein
MITLKENQTNTITYQKETDTPLVTSSYEDGKVFNIIIYPTLENNTDLASITFTTSSSETNPRWETLSFDITSSTNYYNKKVSAYGGTTYNLEVWYGTSPTSSDTSVWGTTETNWGDTDVIWAFSEIPTIDYETITQQSTLKYQDRVFVSGSVSPTQKKYISSNENAVYTVYQG